MTSNAARCLGAVIAKWVRLFVSAFVLKFQRCHQSDCLSFANECFSLKVAPGEGKQCSHSHTCTVPVYVERRSTFQKNSAYVSVNFSDCFCGMSSCCFSVLQCIAAPRRLIKMLIQESSETALHSHGAVSFCTLEYENASLLLLVLTQSTPVCFAVGRGGRENRDKQKIRLQMSGFLGTFCWWVRIGNVVMKL